MTSRSVLQSLNPLIKSSNGVNQVIFTDKCVGFDMSKVKGKIFGFHQISPNGR